MIFALLPVKSPRNAKQRLGSLLDPEQREALARAMFEEMLEKVAAARGIDRVMVVTSDAAAARHARRCGALVFEEEEQRSHSHSADAATRRAIELGADAVALLPIDVPLATVAEIERLVRMNGRAGCASPLLRIVPSADGTGTNALVRTPPDVIPSCFGPGSFFAHLEKARAREVPVEVLRPPGLVFDVDTPEDVAELLARAPECRAARLLREQCASNSQG